MRGHGGTFPELCPCLFNCDRSNSKLLSPHAPVFHQLITLSARASTLGGTVSPIRLAVFRLIISRILSAAQQDYP
jgi:hypothetical protein